MLIATSHEKVVLPRPLGRAKDINIIQSDILAVETFLQQFLFETSEKDNLDVLLNDLNWKNKNQLRYSIYLKVLTLLKNNQIFEAEALLPKIQRYLRILKTSQKYLQKIDEQTVAGKNLRIVQKMAAISFHDWIASLGLEKMAMGHIVAPSGIGKTLMAMICDDMMNSERTIFVVDSVTNGCQSFNSFKEHQLQKEESLQKEVGKLFGKRNKQQSQSTVTVTTFNTLLNKLENFDFSVTDLMIVDEADVTALSPRRAELLKSIAQTYGLVLIGMSATETLKSGRSIKDLFPHPIYRLGLPEGLPVCVELKVIAPTRFFDIYVDIEQVKLTATDQLSLNELRSLNVQKIIEGMNQNALEHYLENHRGERAVFGFLSQKQFKNFLEMSKKYGLRVGVLYHHQSITQKMSKIKDFENGKFDILCGFKMVGRGLDLPFLKIAYNLQYTRSPQLFWQFSLRPSRIDRQNENKIAFTYNFVPQQAFVRNKLGKLILSRIPLTFSSFFEENYFDIYKRLGGGTRPWPLGYERKKILVQHFELGELNTIRSVKEVQFKSREIYEQYEKRASLEKWIHFFKYERNIHSPEEWLEKYPAAGFLKRDVGYLIVNDLGINRHVKNLTPEHYTKVFNALYQMPLALGLRLMWRKKLKQEGIDSPEIFLLNYPENKNGLLKLSERYGFKILNQLGIKHKTVMTLENYAVLFKRLFKKDLSRFYFYLARKEIYYELFPDQTAVSMSESELEKVFLTKAGDFLLKYSGPKRFKNDFGNTILSNFKVAKIEFDTPYFKEFFQKLFLIPWKEGVRQAILKRLESVGVFNEIDYLNRFMNKRIQLMLDIELTFLSELSLRHDRDLPKKLFECLYKISYQEGLRRRLHSFLEKDGIVDSDSFLTFIPNGSTFIKKYGWSILSDIENIASEDSNVLKGIIPFLYLTSWGESLKQKWKKYFLVNFGVRDNKEFVEVFPEPETLNSEESLLLNLKSYFQIPTKSKFALVLRGKTLYQIVIELLYGSLPVVDEDRELIIKYRNKRLDFLEYFNSAYFLFKDMSENLSYDGQNNFERDSVGDLKILNKYKACSEEQKNIFKIIFVAALQNKSEVLKEFSKKRKSTLFEQDHFIKDLQGDKQLLSNNLSLSTKIELLDRYIVLEKQKDNLYSELIKNSQKYIKWKVGYYLKVMGLNSDYQDDLIQRVSMHLRRALDRISSAQGWYAFKSAYVRGAIKSGVIYYKFSTLDHELLSLDQPLALQSNDNLLKFIPAKENNSMTTNIEAVLAIDSIKLKERLFVLDENQRIYLQHTYQFFGENILSDQEISVLIRIPLGTREYRVLKKNAELSFRALIETHDDFRRALFQVYQSMSA